MCLVQPLVDRGREAAIGPVGDHGHGHRCGVLEAGQVVEGAVGRPVVDDDQLPGRVSVAHEGADALSGERELVPAGDDDRCKPADWGRIHGHGCGSPPISRDG